MLLSELVRCDTMTESVGTPEEGWCVVFRGRYVERGPFVYKEDAERKRSDLVGHNNEHTWDNTQVMYGRRATDGSDEYIATRAVNPS